MRDLRMIGVKSYHVLYPVSGSEKVLQDWDWWGPLLLCLALSIKLSLGTSTTDEGIFARILMRGSFVFAATFFIIWFGAAVVTLNGQLLGGNLSFFQSVCVLGYCLFPLVAAGFLNLILIFNFLKIIITGVAYCWSMQGFKFRCLCSDQFFARFKFRGKEGISCVNLK